MNTPAHLLIGLAVCGRRERRWTGPAAFAGGLLPDLSLYLLAGVSLTLLQIPPSRVFGELYFSPAWQAVFAVDNSFILWGLGLAAALFWRSAPGVAFAVAGILHLILDFALHHDDARRHFWPLSDWVFESPLSYWSTAHHAAIVAPAGLVLALIAAAVIWRRWSAWPARLLAVALCAAEIWVVRQWLLFF